MRQNLFVSINIPESSVTNTSGSFNHSYGSSISMAVGNIFGGAEFDVGNGNVPSL